MEPSSHYVSPFSSRYSSEEMSHIFSQKFKILTFRKLWIALASAQKHLGLSITEHQIAQMKEHAEMIDIASISHYEKKFRHDVMAHIHAFGDVCPDAKPILHLGATSCYVTDNTDLIQCKTALHLLIRKLVKILALLASFAKKEAKTPCLSYTHFQSAQPTTMGKRASLWLQDFLWDAHEWERLYENIPFLGAKGATGTQSSFLSLFKGKESKVFQMEKRIAKEFGFTKVLPVSGQTYPRKIDLFLLNALGSFAASSHKMATDIRLLAHDGELLESFEEAQVGSSAMPYKRNPIYSERICGLARFVISLTQNPAYTTATQWLERGLDDSSNRRISIPEAFLGVDAVLNILAHLIRNLRPEKNIALHRLKKEMPSLVMENILMRSVQKGGSRQELHEKLRRLSQKPLEILIKEVCKDPEFRLTRKEIESLLSIQSLIGLAPEQTLSFLKERVQPFLNKWKKSAVIFPSIEV